MKNICLLISNAYNCGGTEKMCFLLANTLKDNDFNVKILSIFGPKKQNDTFFKTKCKIDEIYKQHRKHYVNFSCRLKIQKYFKLNHFDIVIVVDTVHANLCACVAKQSKTRLIVWDHFNYFFNMNNIVRRRAIKNTVKYADAFVVLTKADKKLYKLKYKDLNIIQCYDSLEDLSHKYIDRSQNKTVLAVGRFTKQKGFDLLLQAWNKIEDKCDFDLKIYGYTACQEPKLKKYIAKNNLKQVTLCPVTQNITKAYNDASIYVLSSRWEGQSLTLLEASNASLALVSFDCKHGPNEIIKDGHNGILIESENVDDLANSILKLCKDKALRKQMGKNAFQNVQKFTVENFGEKWINLINCL